MDGQTFTRDRRGRRAAAAEWQENVPRLPLQSEQRCSTVPTSGCPSITTQRPQAHFYSVRGCRALLHLGECVCVRCLCPCVSVFVSLFTAWFPVFIPLSYSKCVCLCVFTSSFVACVFLFFFFTCGTLSVIVQRSGKICRCVSWYDQESAEEEE